MDASLIAIIVNLNYGESDFRLRRLKDAGFVETPGWVFGSFDYHLTMKAKKLMFTLTTPDDAEDL